MPASTTSHESRVHVRATRFEQECVSFFGEVVQSFGVPKSVGQIYGMLYASPVPLSFSDILLRLDISKGSLSQGLQLLRSLGAVNECTGIGSHREYFQPELSLRRLMSGVLQERIAPLAGVGAGRLDRLRELAETGGEHRAFYLDRTKQLNTWRRRLNGVVPLLSVVFGPKT